MKRGTPRHPKMYDLASRLGIPLPYAVGIMEMLWHYAAINTPRGDIGSQPDEAIKQACAFARKAPVLVNALADARWIDADPDHRYILHDWPDHCEQSVVKLLEDRHHDFLPVYRKSLEIRKRKSRDSLASREAKALVKDFEFEEKKDGELVPAQLDEQWQDFRRIYGSTGKPLIEEDFTRAHLVWRVLDFGQRTVALANLTAHKAITDPQFIPKPERFLQGGEYTRAVIARIPSGNSRHDKIRRAMEEA